MADDAHSDPRLADRALGALTGLRVGEALGGEADGLPAPEAASALQAAFPDFGAPTPAHRGVLVLCGAEQVDARPAESAAGAGPTHPAPAWVPVAIAAALQVRADPIAGLVEAVGERLAPGDRDRLTFAAVAALATAVSAALDETPWAQCLSLAISAADLAESSADVYRPGASVGARLAWAHALASRSDEPLAVVELLVGTSGEPQEAIPAAFAVVGVHASSGLPRPMAVVQEAASLGGRAGLIVPVAGALAGAFTGAGAFPVHLRDDIELTPVLTHRDGG